jgi:hypothetical protein
MSLEAAAQLAKGEQFLVIDRAGCLQACVEQRRGVALREDQMVVAGPSGVLKVEAQMPVEKNRHQFSRRHRRGRMPRAACVAGSHRVDTELLGELPTKHAAIQLL